jgi:two-component system cell cycle response regulator DivK
MAKSMVLIIEDNELNLDLAKELLEEIGFETMEAEDADTGIQLAKKYHPDLILMDMHLPNKNGYEASKTLKLDTETKDIPIVAFTALAMKEEKVRAMAYGCSGLISKPIDVDHFAETVAAFLPNKLESPITVSHEMVNQTVSFDEISSINEPALQELLMKLSHDLQTPLRKVKQLGSMLRKSAQEKLSSEECDLLDRMEQSTQQMQDVLSNTNFKKLKDQTIIG